jgi:galactose mutarotase-like enzyme
MPRECAVCSHEMFSRREETRENRLFDVLTDEANGLRLVVSRLGAELIGMQRRTQSGDWVGFLYRDNDITAPANGWTNHATVMGYYLHRLKNGRSFYRGREIKGGNHGFLRTKTWLLAEADPESGALTYRMAPTDFSKIDYPLNVGLDLTYRIAELQVNVAFKFTNYETDLTAHVSFGLHPGFAATSFDSFHFRMPPGRYRRHFSPGNFLSGKTEDLDFEGGEMPFPRGQLAGSFILEFVDVPNREFIYVDPPSGRSVKMNLTGVPYLTLWSDGGPFLCVEPCWGLTDHDRQRAFENKEGIQTIDAGGELFAGFTMEPQLEALG